MSHKTFKKKAIKNPKRNNSFENNLDSKICKCETCMGNSKGCKPLKKKCKLIHQILEILPVISSSMCKQADPTTDSPGAGQTT